MGAMRSQTSVYHICMILVGKLLYLERLSEATETDYGCRGEIEESILVGFIVDEDLLVKCTCGISTSRFLLESQFGDSSS